MVQTIGGNPVKNVMTYKGYMARIEFDPRDNISMGKIIGIADGITFQGETVKELKADFQAAIDHYRADCAATGRTPLKAASGGKSLNQWAEEVLNKPPISKEIQNAVSPQKRLFKKIISI
jgi:predicted HicB family RNase H-like nuclease